MKKRILSLLLAVTMIVSLLPATVFADNLGENPTIAQILATNPDFPTSAEDTLPANAWVCKSDRNKIVYKDGDNSKLTIGSYDSGKFYSNYTYAIDSSVTDGDGGFYTYDTSDHGTIIFYMDSDVLTSITLKSGDSFEGIYSPLTIGDILPSNFPASDKDNTWCNSENDNIYIYKTDSNLVFYDNKEDIYYVSLSSPLTKEENTTVSYKYLQGDDWIQFNMTGENDDELDSIIVSYCSNTSCIGTYAYEAPEAFSVTYNSNGATSGSAPANQTKTAGVGLTLATNTGSLAKAGYTFAGWNTKADGTGTHYDAGANYSTDADVSLYAEWALTIAGILPEDFPLCVDVLPFNTWDNDNGIHMMLIQNTLGLITDESKDFVIAEDIRDALLTKDENNYTYTNNGVTTTFVMSGDVLVGVEIKGLADDYIDFNGMYTAKIIVEIDDANAGSILSPTKNANGLKLSKISGGAIALYEPTDVPGGKLVEIHYTEASGSNGYAEAIFIINQGYAFDGLSYSLDGTNYTAIENYNEYDEEIEKKYIDISGITNCFKLKVLTHDTGMTPTHEHSFVYTESGNKITAGCGGEGTCDLPSKRVSLTLTADDAPYDGAVYDGASTNDATVNFAGITGATVGPIEYYLEDGTTKTTIASGGAISEGMAPQNAGSYVAKVTVTYDTDKTITAEKAFAITSRPVTLVAGSAEKTYNGEPLTCTTFTVKEDTETADYGFVSGEGIDHVTMTPGSAITDVGTEDNEIDTIYPKDGTNLGNYNITKEKGTLTVTASNALTVKAAPYEGVYDGEFHNITYAVKIGEDECNDAAVYLRESGTTDWIPVQEFEPYMNVMAAKTVEIKAEKTGYQAATDSATVTINKATPYIYNLPGPSDITYGQTLADSTLFGGSAWVSETDKTPISVWFEWTTADTVPTVADSDTTEYDVTVTPLGDFETNFATTTCKVKLTVGPADYADVTKAASGSLGAASGSTVEITLPAIPEGAAYGTATKTNADDKYTLSSISGGKITATSTGIDAGTGSMTFTVPVTPDNNHNGYNITVTITSTFKEVVTITADTDGFTYGDSGKIGYKNVSVVDNLVDVNTLVPTYYLSDGTTKTNTENSGASSEGAVPANAGSYKVVLSVPSNNETYFGSTTVTFTIAKKDVTITAKDKSAYVGETAPGLGENDYTVTGLLGSDTLITLPAIIYKPEPDMTKEGTVAINVSGADAGSNYEIKYVSGTLTISNRPVPSSGGSNSSTVTVPVAGDENTVKVQASVSGSTATVKKINDADLEKVTEGESVSIDLSAAGKNVDTAKIPTETVEKIAEKSAMTVKLPVATVEFDKAATEEIADQAKGNNIELVVDDIKEVSLNAVQKESVGKLDTAIIIDAHLASNGSKLCTADNGGFGGGSAKVILPYEIKNNRKPENYNVFYVNEAGKLEKLNAVYDEELKAFVFEIEHFSVYAVAFEQFVDIDANAYYYDAVKWAVANGVTDGVDATHFNPSGITNRAQMVTFLWKAAGKPEPTITETPFTDLDPDWYYYKAVLWAYENGITDGTSATTFEPNKNVSRAQVVTFLWRYAEKPVVDYFMNMSDVESGKYYTEAVRWALSEKITEGTTTTTFSPDDDCLRGQIVTFLYRDFAK